MEIYQNREQVYAVLITNENAKELRRKWPLVPATEHIGLYLVRGMDDSFSVMSEELFYSKYTEINLASTDKIKSEVTKIVEATRLAEENMPPVVFNVSHILEIMGPLFVHVGTLEARIVALEALNPKP